jgi:hypothetical protein
MGFPLEPLTAHDIGQAAGKKDHCQDQKKDIEHVKSPLQTWSSTQPCDRRFTVARSKSEGSQKKALQHQDFIKIDLPVSIRVRAQLTHLGWAGLPLLWIESDDCQRFYVCKG